MMGFSPQFRGGNVLRILCTSWLSMHRAYAPTSGVGVGAGEVKMDGVEAAAAAEATGAAVEEAREGVERMGRGALKEKGVSSANHHTASHGKRGRQGLRLGLGLANPSRLALYTLKLCLQLGSPIFSRAALLRLLWPSLGDGGNGGGGGGMGGFGGLGGGAGGEAGEGGRGCGGEGGGAWG